MNILDFNLNLILVDKFLYVLWDIVTFLYMLVI